MGTQETSWNSRIIVAALSLAVFPVFITIAFYASRTLVPSLAKLKFNIPSQNASSPISEHTISIHTIVFNTTLPSPFNIPFPRIPSITYSDILIVIAVIVVILVCLQAFRMISSRRSIKPVSDIVLIEERNKVATILDETVRKLSLGSNYRDTVLKCYKLIAETLETRSSLDGRALTASEFMKVVSERLKLDPANLSRVTSLFEVARYSENEVTRENASDAIECLSSFSSELKTTDISLGPGGDRVA